MPATGSGWGRPRAVFLSSTSVDLAAHRAAVVAKLSGMRGYRFVTMDEFGADDATPEEHCRARLAECAVYLGIIGHRYGSCPAGSTRSFTEMEYDEATRTRKQR